MNDRPAIPSDREFDELLYAVSDALDVPPMADGASRARRRIEARGETGRPRAPFTTVSPPRDDRAAFQPKEILQLPLEEQRSKIREFALLAAGVAAAMIVTGILTFVFRGYGDDASVDSGDNGLSADHPLAAEPYDIPGYEFVGAVGRPQVPNEPVDVAIGPDGTHFVLDAAFDRVIAYTAEGDVKTDWGDQGFSAPITDATALGVGPQGVLYVAASQVHVLDANGQQSDTWAFPASADAETRVPRSQGLVIDSVGNVYVAGRGVIWRFEAGTGAATTIKLDSETDVQLEIDSQGQLYAASRPGGIYRVSPDGELEFVGRTSGQEDINGFAVAPDGRLVVFRISTSSGKPSSFIILDSDGSEIASWPIDRAGFFMGNLGPFWVGLTVTPDGTIVLPDPMDHRISFYDPDGTLISEIRDDRPDAFGRLWRISVDGEGNVLGYDPSIDPRVLRFASDGELLREMPFEAALLGGMASLFSGNGFTATADGGFIIANRSSNRISTYSAEGELVQEWGEMDTSRSGGGLAFPDAVAVDQQGYVYIVDEGFAGRLVDNLRRFTVDGEFVAEVGSVSYPARADITYQDGTIWAANEGEIARFPADGGDPETIATPNASEEGGNLPGYPFTLALDAEGNILTYMRSSNEEDGSFPGLLAKLDPQGEIIWTAELEPDSSSRYVDLAIAPDGTLYLSDSETRKILVYRPTDESQVVATTEPTPTYNPVGEVLDLLVVEEIADPERRPQYAIVDPDTMERRDLPPGELAGISPEGEILLLIDQEPGEEWIRLDIVAVSTETFEEVWRTDIGELNQNWPNTVYYDTVVVDGTTHVAIHDPDYRGEMLEIAALNLANGSFDGAAGMDTDVGKLGEPWVGVDLLAQSDQEGSGYFILIENHERTETTLVGAPFNSRTRVDLVLPPGERYLLPDGTGIVTIPESGLSERPVVSYLLFDSLTTGEIPLPFNSSDAIGTTIVEYALSHDGRTLYALSPYDGQIAIVDLENLGISSIETLVDATLPNSLSESPDIEAMDLHYSQQPLSISPDGRYIFALGPLYELNDGYTPGIWKIDMSTWTVVDEAPPGGSWSNLSLHSNHDGSRLYVSLGLQWPSPNVDGEYEISQPGLLVMDTESFDDQSGLIDLDGYRTVGTLADLCRGFHGRSPAVAGVAAR